MSGSFFVGLGPVLCLFLLYFFVIGPIFSDPGYVFYDFFSKSGGAGVCFLSFVMMRIADCLKVIQINSIDIEEKDNHYSVLFTRTRFYQMLSATGNKL